jgi:hypothetical protein
VHALTVPITGPRVPTCSCVGAELCPQLTGTGAGDAGRRSPIAAWVR